MRKENRPRQLRARKKRLDRGGSSEHIIRIYGNIAILVGLWRAKGKNNGQPFDYTARFTSVWLKENNKIRIVTDQSNEINKT